jgi:phenylacetate-CoA ligase
VSPPAGVERSVGDGKALADPSRAAEAGIDPPFDSGTACWSADMPASAEGLRSWQLRRAWEVAESLAASNPFYAARIRLPAERTEAAFRSLPVTTKREVVDDCLAHPPYGSRTVGASEDLRQIVETSGTSGVGREVYALDAQDELAVFRGAAVGFWWAGVRPGTTILLTLPVGMSAAGIWYYGGLRLLRAKVLPVGAYPTERKVAALTQYRPQVIVGTPSYIDRLATICRDQGLDPVAAGVGSLVVAGEPYSAEWAIEAQRRWNAVLYEQYGCTQRVMAWSCPGGVVRDGRLGTLHFPPELCYWEVIDPETGEPVAEGECGELIATPLQASGSWKPEAVDAAGLCPASAPAASNATTT